MKQRLTYRNDRDVELWVVSGPDWEIPLKCRHSEYAGTDHFHALPAVPIGFTQAAALEGVMKSIEGDIETGSVMAGQSVGMVKCEQPTAEILEELVGQAIHALAGRDQIGAT